MPGKDKHQPWGNATFTHKNSQITSKNSSDDEEPTPRRNRDNGYPASNRDNPLTARRDNSSDDDHKPDPSCGLRVVGRDHRSSQRSSNFQNFTVDETNDMSQGDDSDNNNSNNETPYIQTTMSSEHSQSKKYPTTVTEDATNEGFPAYRNTPTDDDSTTPKQSTASKHTSGTEGYTNNNRMVYHSRWDPQGHQTKKKGDQPLNTTTDIHHHQELKDKDENQPGGARAIDETSNKGDTKNISGVKESQDAKLSKIIFNLEDGDNASTDIITMRLAQT
jgi:hypothetical protein